jgi:hypothetical protein
MCQNRNKGTFMEVHQYLRNSANIDELPKKPFGDERAKRAMSQILTHSCSNIKKHRTKKVKINAPILNFKFLIYKK